MFCRATITLKPYFRYLCITIYFCFNLIQKIFYNYNLLLFIHLENFFVTEVSDENYVFEYVRAK